MADVGRMKKTRTCQDPTCTEAAADRYCAFHHLALVTGADLFSGLLEGVGGMSGQAVLGFLFEILDEPVPVPLCRHDAPLGSCYLSEAAEFPGATRTPWELRASAYSLGIPLN